LELEVKTPRYGFTVIELMITLAVAATLTTIGVPALSSFLKNSGLKSEAFELLDAITVARSEAIKRKTKVILCRSADPAATTPACSGSAYTWSSGWIVYASGDTNSTFNAGTDILIAVNEGSSDPIVIKANGTGNNYLEYNPDGSLDEGGTGRYAICDDRGEEHGRQINIPLMGRPYLEKGTVSNPISDCDSPT
jgi:type IV fimbrial biogenesis protein FimT